MIAHVLQPWTSLWLLSGQGAVQTQDEWVAFDGFRDLSVWIHVAHASKNLNVHLQTGPTDDTTLFPSLAVTRTLVTGPGVYFAVNKASHASQPGLLTSQLQRFLRWAIVPEGAGDYSVTFRIIVCANPVVPSFRITRGDGDEAFTNPLLGGQ